MKTLIEMTQEAGLNLLAIQQKHRQEIQSLNKANNAMLDILTTMPHPEIKSGITHLTDDWYEWDAKRRAAIKK